MTALNITAAELESVKTLSAQGRLSEAQPKGSASIDLNRLICHVASVSNALLSPVRKAWHEAGRER